MIEAEIITRRRKWTPEEKATLLAEVDAEGGRVAMVARRHGLSESLLYNWRSVAKATEPMHGPEPMEFRPIGVIGRASEAPPVLLAAPEPRLPTGERREDRTGKIEIALPNGVRVKVGASVSETALSRVLRAVQGAV
jgi:transposase